MMPILQEDGGKSYLLLPANRKRNHLLQIDLVSKIRRHHQRLLD
jgi:hypothetical protein